jgi:hypothetical protein
MKLRLIFEMEIEHETEENDEEIDIDVTELSLDEEQIEELIGKLNILKENKESVSIQLDEENDLLIHHEGEEDSESEVGE